MSDALRVLLVDDSADVRQLVRLGMEFDDRFAEVTEAVNGREAIAAAEASPPDVILLDEMMPIMTGLEALPGLREAAPGARIVVYSASVDEIDLRDSPIQPDAFVAKTADLDALYDTLAG